MDDLKYPWLNGNLRIPHHALAEIAAIGERAYSRNEEACGYISGPVSEPLLASDVTELENLANRYHSIDPENHPRTGREYFKINSLKFERALAEADRQGHPIKVFFHSHLDCGAYFSREDAAAMTLGDGTAPTYPLSYLVTAVDQGKTTRHALFIWDETTRSFVESPLVVD